MLKVLRTSWFSSGFQPTIIRPFNHSLADEKVSSLKHFRADHEKIFFPRLHFTIHAVIKCSALYTVEAFGELIPSMNK